MNIKNRKYFRYFLFLNNLNQYTKLQNLNKNGEVKKEFTYEYDNNGNLIKDDINQYFYDYKNRLVKVVQNEVVKLDENGNMIENIPEETIVEFTYDILGRRIQKKTENKTINYTYAGQNAIKEIITDKTTQEVTTRENIYSNNLDDILLTVVTKPDNTKTYQYYTKNHLNSIVAITDETGNILEEYIYDVFGKAYIRDGKSSNHREFKKSSLGVTRLYTGREYDYEPNLYFLRARYYNPTTGRFISRDPIDVIDDVNLYAYVGNNGVMFVDRSGLSKDLYSNDFITNHDATSLLLEYMKQGRDESSLFSGNIPYINYFEKTMGEWNVKNVDAFNDLSFGNSEVFILGQKVELSELGNLLVGYNGAYTGVNLPIIYTSGITVELRNYMGGYKEGTSLDIIHEAAILDEIQDIPWYTVGYMLAQNEINNGIFIDLERTIYLGNLFSEIAVKNTIDRKNELDSLYEVNFSINNLIYNEY